MSGFKNFNLILTEMIQISTKFERMTFIFLFHKIRSVKYRSACNTSIKCSEDITEG